MTKKIGEKKRAKQFFQKHTNCAIKKCWEKNRWKKCQKTYFIFTRKSSPKNGGKKHAKQFFQKHTNSTIKICWEKNRWKKVRKHVFYIHTNILTKEWGEKKARNNFSRNTPIVRAKNVRKKIVGKKCEETFF